MRLHLLLILMDLLILLIYPMIYLFNKARSFFRFKS